MRECYSKSNLMAKSVGALVKKQVWGRFGVPKVAKSNGVLLQRAFGNSQADLPDPGDIV